MIYLDHSATTPVHPDVLGAMEPYWREHFGNPASSHAAGQGAAGGLARARRQVADLLGAPADTVHFTSGGTESDNMVVWGRWEAAGRAGRMVHSAVEHPAIREPAQRLPGTTVDEIPVDAAGRVRLEELERLLAQGERPFLVSVMHASNEIGTVQPIAEIGALCREHGVPLHVDAVQTVAQLPFDVDALGVDLVTVTAHKIYGPKGIGALYVRPGVELTPLMIGGGQEGGLRPGTVNVSGAVGLGAACELAARRLGEAERLVTLRTRLLDGLRDRLQGVRILGHETERLPGHLSVALPGVNSRDLVVHLDALGVACSRGSACAAGDAHGSPTLHAMGHGPEVADGMLRLTLGHGTTEAEIDEVIELAPTAVASLA